MNLTDKNSRENDTNEDSLEFICNTIDLIGDMYADNEDYDILIAETLLEIPKDIRDNVIYGCDFIIDKNLGLTFNLYYGPNREQPLILLNCLGLNRRSKKFKMSVIAHEIAHFTLNHHKTHPQNLRENLEQEKEADDLIEKWGFQRTNEQSYKNKI